MLQRAGLRDALFIAMSNYYYDEKAAYLAAANGSAPEESRTLPHSLSLASKGIALQCKRLSEEIRRHVSKALFRNVMYDLFTRLESKKKRVIAERQIEILKLLLQEDSITLGTVGEDEHPSLQAH